MIAAEIDPHDGPAAAVVGIWKPGQTTLALRKLPVSGRLPLVRARLRLTGGAQPAPSTGTRARRETPSASAAAATAAATATTTSRLNTLGTM